MKNQNYKVGDTITRNQLEDDFRLKSHAALLKLKIYVSHDETMCAAINDKDGIAVLNKSGRCNNE